MFSTLSEMNLGPYSSTVLKKVLCLVTQIFLFLAAYERNTTSDWLNHMVYPIKSCVAFKFKNSWRKRQRTFLRMVGE